MRIQSARGCHHRHRRHRGESFRNLCACGASVAKDIIPLLRDHRLVVGFGTSSVEERKSGLASGYSIVSQRSITRIELTQACCRNLKQPNQSVRSALPALISNDSASFARKARAILYLWTLHLPYLRIIAFQTSACRSLTVTLSFRAHALPIRQYDLSCHSVVALQRPVIVPLLLAAPTPLEHL
jgi:hypothetical protein